MNYVYAFLYECPEFFSLPSSGGDEWWVLMGANGEYLLGTFDGLTFNSDGKRRRVVWGNVFYAGQTIAAEPLNRRIMMAWLRAEAPGMGFNQCMSLPLELKLRGGAGETILTMFPVPEVESLRCAEIACSPAVLAGAGQSLCLSPRDAFDLCCTVRLDVDAELGLESGEFKLRYVPASQTFLCDGLAIRAESGGNELKLRLIGDRTTLEVFINDGEIYLPVAMSRGAQGDKISISSLAGKLEITQIDLFELKSIWSTPC